MACRQSLCRWGVVYWDTVNDKNQINLKALLSDAEKKLLRLLLIIGAILLVPLIAMQFTNEVDWGWGDFILAGLLLFGTGLVIEFIIRKIRNKTYSRILIVLLVLCLG